VTNEERQAAIAEGRHLERISIRDNRLRRWIDKGKIVFEADKGQCEAFNELFSCLQAQCGGSKTQATDRLLAALGNEVADGLENNV